MKGQKILDFIKDNNLEDVEINIMLVDNKPAMFGEPSSVTEYFISGLDESPRDMAEIYGSVSMYIKHLNK